MLQICPHQTLHPNTNPKCILSGCSFLTLQVMEQIQSREWGLILLDEVRCASGLHRKLSAFSFTCT